MEQTVIKGLLPLTIPRPKSALGSFFRCAPNLRRSKYSEQLRFSIPRTRKKITTQPQALRETGSEPTHRIIYPQ
jgi:hypothetical protein